MATRSNKNNSVNDKDLVDWIIREEGFNTKPEGIGDGKMTLGSGLTDPKWHALYKKKGNKWSEEDNRRAVAEEVANRRKWAEKTIPNWEALPDSSQKALLSYKYNYDFTPTNSPKLFHALADSNLKEAARQMDATSKDPKFKKGLQERRQREQEWFLSEIEPEPEPFQVVPNIIHEEIPVSTVVSTPYRTAVNNPTIPTTMIPDSNSYITTRRITPSEDRSNRVQEALNGISDYSRLMKNTSIVNNPIPQYSPNTNIKYAEGGYLNSNNNNQPIYKDWNSLSMREKSEYMKTAIRNGITTLSDIKQAYNQFASGGNKKEISSTTPFWQKPIIPFRQRNEVIITPDSEYNRYLNTLPDNQRFTPNDKYDSYLYWKLNGRPKDFKEAHDKEMFTYDNSDHAYHANSVAWEDEDTGYFMKPKDHDTVKYELDWFNKGLVTEEGGWQRPETLSEWRESKDFRNDYDLLDDPNRPNFYMYKHKKKAEGGNLYKKGGSKDEGYNNFVAYTQRAEGTHWQGQQDKFKREKGKSATQYYWDEAKKRYKDKWDKWTPSQRIAVADTMYNYGYWDGTFDAYKYDMNVKGVDNNAYWKKYGKGHTRRFNERKKMFYGNEVPEMIAAPKDASIRIPSVKEYVEPFIPTFMPSNPEAFFTPLESYQRPVIEEVVEQPLVKAANAYSQEALDREQRQRNLNTLNFVLGMTSPQGSDNSFVNTIGMLTGNINANGGNIHIKPSHRGRLTELKKRTGKSEAELYKTGGPAVRKMITFARNARKWKHGLGGNLYDGTTEDTQQMAKPNIFQRPDGSYFYSIDGTEIDVTPMNTLGDNPAQWTYVDSSNRVYRPNQTLQNNYTLTEVEDVNPLERAANNYFRELDWRAKNDPSSIALQGKYTMPLVLSPMLGKAAATALANPYVDAALTSGFGAHGLNHVINEGIDGWGDAAMTALEIAPLGQLAKPLYKSASNVVNFAYNKLPWTYKIPENPNMAYRRMGPLERDWLMEGNELSTRKTNALTEAEEETARAASEKGRRFSLFKAGAEHGGRKQFAKGQPWKGTTVTHGEEQILAIPGEGLPWVSGKHFHGPQGDSFGVGDISFEEAPFGSHIDLLTEEGYTGVNPSLLDGSVIYSPFKIFDHNFGYKKLYPKVTTPHITAENAASIAPVPKNSSIRYAGSAKEDYSNSGYRVLDYLRENKINAFLQGKPFYEMDLGPLGIRRESFPSDWTMTKMPFSDEAKDIINNSAKPRILAQAEKDIRDLYDPTIDGPDIEKYVKDELSYIEKQLDAKINEGYELGSDALFKAFDEDKTATRTGGLQLTSDGKIVLREGENPEEFAVHEWEHRRTNSNIGGAHYGNEKRLLRKAFTKEFRELSETVPDFKGMNMDDEMVTTVSDARETLIGKTHLRKTAPNLQNKMIDKSSDEKIFEAVEKANAYGSFYIEKMRKLGKLTPELAQNIREALKHVGAYAIPTVIAAGTLYGRNKKGRN